MKKPFSGQLGSRWPSIASAEDASFRLDSPVRKGFAIGVMWLTERERGGFAHIPSRLSI